MLAMATLLLRVVMRIYLLDEIMEVERSALASVGLGGPRSAGPGD